MPISRQNKKILRWQGKVLKNCCCGGITGNYELFVGIGITIIRRPEVPDPGRFDTTLITAGPAPFPINQTSLSDSCITASYVGNTAQTFTANMIAGQQFTEAKDIVHKHGMWLFNGTNKTIYLNIKFKNIAPPPNWPYPTETEGNEIIPPGSLWRVNGTPSSSSYGCNGTVDVIPAYIPFNWQYNFIVSFTNPNGP